ncbi:MAG: TatD family hydrolase [Candidatus Margulisbacteria bacterium]|jgi:TatD DNase family protein|nr:TatD family hydrolase [Candidatus Margulisiibacteriota bacterium]
MIDTHAHLQIEPLARETPEALIQRAQEQGVSVLINVATSLPDARAALALAQKHQEIYAAVGVHPQEAETLFHDALLLKELEHLLGQDRVVALGEVGLDYYKNKVTPAVQKQVLEWQIRLALANDKPLIIHNREADADVYDILKYYKCRKAVFHCYGRGVEYTRKILDLGYYVSFTGNITFPKNQQGQAAVKFVPLDRIMLETDCPFMAPVPRRGQTNEPALLPYVAEKVAELKELTVAEVEKSTDRNARKFFNLREA